MLAAPADAASHDRILGRADLIFERKYDGIRALVLIEPVGPERAAVRIRSRAGNDKTGEFPDIAAPLARFGRRLDRPVLIDGEIVAVDARGAPLGFQHLQGRLQLRGAAARAAPRSTPAAFIAFDLLRDGAEDLRVRPFVDRRRRLEALLRRTGSRTVRLAASAAGGGRRLLSRALRLGWEGLVAKEPHARYVAGRHAAWRKLKFTRSGEFVVGGWTEPEPGAARTGFGALLLGYHPAHAQPAAGGRPGPLVFAGQVGSGFTQAELELLAAGLTRLAADRSPFRDVPPARERCRWVQPVLVVEVRFTEWTLDGVLRNPVYVRLRHDKPAHGVRTPAGRVRAAPGRAAAHGRRPRRTPPDPALAGSLDTLLDTLEDLEERRRRGALVLPDGARVPVGNLEKVFWPDAGITKGELLRFQLRIAPYLLPVVADRPLVMQRFPHGVRGKAFHQHRAPTPRPAGVRAARVRERRDTVDSETPYLIGGELQTLLYTAQLAVISQDPWLSRLPDVAAADQAALDLDPPPGCAFARVLDVACWLHDELGKLGAPSFPKTSGSRGLHIHVPLPPGTPHEAGLLFCRIVATVVAGRHPDAATVERAVSRRRAGAVCIDYLQNVYGKTLAAAYSPRASAFAGVSTPLTWEEVHDGVRGGLEPRDFTLRSVFARLEQVGDLWAALRVAPPARLEAALSYDRRTT